MPLVDPLLSFFELTFSKKSSKNTSMSKSLDPGQASSCFRFVELGLGPNCLQRYSKVATRRQI